MSVCRLCEVKKPKRFCPGVGGDICPTCCGTHRENTVDCPLDCMYMLEARRHEKPPEVDPEKFPNTDVKVTESFIRDNQETLLFLARTVLQAAEATSNASDHDVKEALDALIRTYRTLDSGLIYQTRPSNPYAAAIQSRIEEGITQFRKMRTEAAGMETLRDSQILGLLVFLERMQLSHNNGRPKSKAFLGFLREYFPVETPQSSLAL